jgi:uncharacterized membrane protein
VDRGRLEAFSDGVFAIVITVMVLGLRPPAGTDWAALKDVGGPFLVYVLSFIYLGIYWNNHHHLLKHLLRVNGSVMWANLLLLFWLTLFPFVTEWWGQQPTATVPTVVYGLVLLIAAIAYYLLQTLIVRQHGGAGSGALRARRRARLGQPVAVRDALRHRRTDLADPRQAARARPEPLAPGSPGRCPQRGCRSVTCDGASAYTLKREDSRTLVLVDDVGCSSLTCNDALGTSTGGDTRRNLLRTRCGLEPPGNPSSIEASACPGAARKPRGRSQAHGQDECAACVYVAVFAHRHRV